MKAKGTILSSIQKFVRDKFDDRYDQFITALSSESRRIYSEAILATEWYDLEVGVIAPTRQIATLFYGGDFKKAALESGEFSAYTSLTGVYKVFVMISTPQFMMARASKILRSFYDPSQIEVVESGEKFMKLHLTEMDMASEVVELRIAGWIQQALQICGCKDVEVRFVQSFSHGDDITEYEVVWK